MAQAIRWTLTFYARMNWQGMVMATDCTNLITAIEEKEEATPLTWQALGTILQIAEGLENALMNIHVVKVSRQILLPAHHLANWARISGQQR
jgi:hypothetical protein